MPFLYLSLLRQVPDVSGQLKLLALSSAPLRGKIVVCCDCTIHRFINAAMQQLHGNWHAATQSGSTLPIPAAFDRDFTKIRHIFL